MFHYFDEAGYYTHSGEMPINPVTGKTFAHNPAVCTPDPLPLINPETEQRRRVGGVWVVEAVPSIMPEPEPLQKYPIFVGNQKLDLFTKEEQLATTAATMSDPVVKLMYDRLIGSAYMSYEDPETEQGLSLLVSKGLLTQDRKDEVVAAMQPV